jgi:hypothetical protein
LVALPFGDWKWVFRQADRRAAYCAAGVDRKVKKKMATLAKVGFPGRRVQKLSGEVAEILGFVVPEKGFLGRRGFLSSPTPRSPKGEGRGMGVTSRPTQLIGGRAIEGGSGGLATNVV